MASETVSYGRISLDGLLIFHFLFNSLAFDVPLDTIFHTMLDERLELSPQKNVVPTFVSSWGFLSPSVFEAISKWPVSFATVYFSGPSTGWQAGRQAQAESILAGREAGCEQGSRQGWKAWPTDTQAGKQAGWSARG